MRSHISVAQVFRTLSYAVVAFAGFVGQSVNAQTTGGAFVTTRGADTVAVEQFTRIGNVLTGDYVTRPGGTITNHYVLTFDVNNRPSKLELTQQRADGTAVPGGPRSVTLTVGDKESTVVIQRDTATTRKFAVIEPYPLLGTSLGMFEVAFKKMRGEKKDSTSFAGLPLNSPVLPNPILVTFFKTDSARVWSAQGPLFVKVSAIGEIQGLSGRATDSPIEARRVGGIDLKKLLAGFAAADAAGKVVRP